VNPDRGMFEIRVHGVSGTLPADLLKVPGVVRVAGDELAGFYQPATHSTEIPDAQPGTVREAYSWGGLTSGSKLRAFWLLLLPFMLVNVAFHAASMPLAGASERQAAGRSRARAGLHSWALRVFALSLTVTMVLAAVSISMDLVGWQYVRRGQDAPIPWLSWLFWRWLDHPGRQLALTALAPLAAVLLLWRLAQRSWARYESASVPLVDPAHTVRGNALTPLENRAMFNGRAPVRRLRAVHITAGFAVIALMLLAPLWRSHHRPLPTLLLTATVVGLLVYAVVLVSLPGITDRESPRRNDADVYAVLPWISLAVTVATGAYVALSSALGGEWPSASGANAATSGELPGFALAVVVLFGVQLTLLVLLFVLCLLGRREMPADPAPAWAGFASVLLTGLGWLIGGGLAVAVILASARVLGLPVAVSHVVAARDLIVPTAVLWAAASALAVFVPIAVGTVVVLVAWLRAPRRLAAHVSQSYPGVAGRMDDPAVRARVNAISRRWVLGSLTESAEPVVGWMLAGFLAVVTAAAVGFAVDPSWIYDHARFAVVLGVLALVALAGALLELGRRVYSSPRQRRTVGILWDVGTFWPRAVHPLAPPCYAERTVPDLLRRIEYRTEHGSVVLSCHSQGTVIGAATLLQSSVETARSVALLTYGAPLRRLYSRYFPAYFGSGALHRLGSDIGDGSEGRTDWRWRNLYRPTDPIGSFVVVNRFGQVGATDDVDEWLLDPAFDRPPGDGTWPAAKGHSDYWADPGYAQAVALLEERLGRGEPTEDRMPKSADLINSDNWSSR
jgi:hypothetical protein